MSPAKPANADRTPLGARRPPFDSVTIGFHWATVLIVLAMFATAWLHSLSHDAATKAILLQTHRSLGVTIWMATVLRLTWRLTNSKLPPFPSHMTNIHRAIVKGSEYCLYALLLIQPATGLAHTLFRGHQFTLFFWWIPPLVPTDAALRDAFMLAHQLGAYAFGALVIGHAGAAIFHHSVLHDDVFQCMAPVMPTKRSDQEYLSGGIIRRHCIAALAQSFDPKAGGGSVAGSVTHRLLLTTKNSSFGRAAMPRLSASERAVCPSPVSRAHRRIPVPMIGFHRRWQRRL